LELENYFNINRFQIEVQEKMNEFFKTIPKIKDKDLDWKYIEVVNSIDLNKSYNQFSSILLILFSMRIFYFLMISPIIKFFLKNFSTLLGSIFNLLVVLFKLIISYVVVIHILLGSKSLTISDILTTIILVIRFILKCGDGELLYGLDNFSLLLNVLFIFLIVNFGYVFLYSHVKEIFYIEIKAYKSYIKRKEIEVIGDYFEFLRNSISAPLYFWWKEFNRLKRERYTLAPDETFNVEKFENSKGNKNFNF